MHLGSFKTSKQENSKYFDGKFSNLLIEINTDNLCDDLFQNLRQLNKISAILLNFKNNSEEIQKIQERRFLKSKEN